MVRTETPVCDFGRPAPDFRLPGVDGKVWTLNEARGNNGLLVMFICNHCPFVNHVNAGLVQLARDYQNKGAGFIAISSNDAVTHPEDGPQQMKTTAGQLGYPFPYLYDETQEVAKAFAAACTPDFFVYDKELRLVYRGQLDDSRPGNEIPVTGNDIRAAKKE